jgi:hypothetical protein
MRRFSLLLLVVSLAVSIAHSQTSVQAKYDDLVRRAQSGDRSVDLAELRQAAGKAGIESDVDARSRLMKAAGQKDFKGMATAADVVIKSNFADLDAQYFAKIAAKELGKQADEDFHHWAEIGLLTALRASGDGRSPETAMKVISVSEEYFILRIMGQMPKQQSLSSCAGHPCDIYKATDPKSNEEYTWYFDVSIPINRMRDALGEGRKPKKKD